jgi:hypothetical protein
MPAIREMDKGLKNVTGRGVEDTVPMPAGEAL